MSRIIPILFAIPAAVGIIALAFYQKAGGQLPIDRLTWYMIALAIVFAPIVVTSFAKIFRRAR